MSAAQSLAAKAALQPVNKQNQRNTHCAPVGISSMNLSAVDFTPRRGTDKSPSNEIESGQSLQSFLINNAITSSSGVSHISRSPQVQHERSQPPQFSQLDLLELLEKSLESLEPALCIKRIPAALTVGEEPRFWLIHRESQLRIPGQFSCCEAEFILKTTEHWHWQIRHRPRTPDCNKRLLTLLTAVCTQPSKASECAA